MRASVSADYSSAVQKGVLTSLLLRVAVAVDVFCTQKCLLGRGVTASSRETVPMLSFFSLSLLL